MSTDAQQDKLLRNVFAITFDAAHADTAANPPVIHLSSVAEVWPPVDAALPCQLSQAALLRHTT